MLWVDRLAVGSCIIGLAVTVVRRISTLEHMCIQAILALLDILQVDVEHFVAQSKFEVSAVVSADSNHKLCRFTCAVGCLYGSYFSWLQVCFLFEGYNRLTLKGIAAQTVTTVTMVCGPMVHSSFYRVRPATLTTMGTILPINNISCFWVLHVGMTVNQWHKCQHAQTD